MRKILCIILVMASLIMGGMLTSCSSWEDRVETLTEYEGAEVEVIYNPLNVREEPNGRIINELEYGTKVTLTGNRCEATYGSNYADIWYEIRYVDNTGEVAYGWVFTDGITKPVVIERSEL